MATMSLDEARKILGEDGDELSDEQLEQTIIAPEALAREMIQAIMNGNTAVPLDE